METIDIKLRPSGGSGIFHDSREDVRRIAKVVNLLIDKMNELIEENNELKKAKKV